MSTMTPDTSPRPEGRENDRDYKTIYARTYLFIRVLVGGIGLALPTTMIVLDRFLFKGGILVKGSLSAYYHTGARDLFVAALSVTGFLLITYMVGEKETPGYRMSSIAGYAALVRRPKMLTGNTGSRAP